MPVRHGYVSSKIFVPFQNSVCQLFKRSLAKVQRETAF